MAALDLAFTDHPPSDGDAPASITAFTSISRTATPNPGIFGSAEDSGGLVVVIDITAANAGGVILTIEGVDRASQKTWVILTSASFASTGTRVLRVSPNIIAVANLIAQDLVPQEVIIRVAHGDANPTTYTVGVHFTA